jgi:hypothetical protein
VLVSQFLLASSVFVYVSLYLVLVPLALVCSFVRSKRPASSLFSWAEFCTSEPDLESNIFWRRESTCWHALYIGSVRHVLGQTSYFRVDKYTENRHGCAAANLVFELRIPSRIRVLA